MKQRTPKHGDHYNYLGAGYIFGVDTYEPEIDWLPCRRCEARTRNYCCHGLGSDELKKIVFCWDCHSTKFVPKLGLSANGNLPVKIQYEDGTSEDGHAKDFTTDRRRPAKVFHCGDQPMHRYYSEPKTADVWEEVYKCPLCQQEKLLKHFIKGWEVT